MLSSFTQMSAEFSGTANGQAIDYTSSYSIVYRSPTTYKVNVAWSMGPSFTAWVNADGTVEPVLLVGQNLTGTQAASMFNGAMVPFATVMSYTQQTEVYTSSQHVHLSGQGTATFGPTTMNVVNYAANSLPLTFTYCGSTTSLAEFSLQVGSIPSSSMQMLTYVHMKGTSGSQSVDFTLKLISCTWG